MSIDKIVSHLISSSEYLSKKRYNRMMRSVEVKYNAFSESSAKDYNKLLQCRDVIANYANKNHLKVYMEVQENSEREGGLGFVRRIAIIAKKFGHELYDSVLLQKDNQKPDFVHTEKKNVLLKRINPEASYGNKSFYIYSGEHRTEDKNFIRSVYRTIESLNNKLNRIGHYE